jgi:hypothetical protein
MQVNKAMETETTQQLYVPMEIIFNFRKSKSLPDIDMTIDMPPKEEKQPKCCIIM